MARKPRNTDNTPNTLEDTMSTTDTETPIADELEAADVDLDVEEPDEDVEETDGTEATTDEAKEPAKPKRGDLPEGFVTPIQFAKILGEKGLHKNREGVVQTEVKPQMVYSYMKNSPKEDRLETIAVKDSNGNERQALKLDEALAWWGRKNERADQRKQNAAEKAQKQVAKAETSKQAAEETDPGAATGLAEAEEAE
jgi:hypothetical protein